MSETIESIREKPNQRLGTLSTGLALYSMFFGAGNVVFPLILGRESGTQTSTALLGIGISGVLFPFLGLVAMMFYGGDLKAFLSRLGKWPSFLCNLILNVSLGLFIVSRLFTLMHASVKTFLPGMPIELFSAFAALLIFFLTYKPNRIVTLLGTILTPLLLLVLGILVFSGILHAPASNVVEGEAGTFLLKGLKCGYQMMDLISALLFSTLVIPHLMGGEGIKTPKLIFKKMMGASLIAALLLMITYVGLASIAAHHGASLPASVLSEDLLNALAFKILGPQGGVIAATIVFFACLTTAISCSSIFGTFLRKEIFLEKVHPHITLLLAVFLAAILATLGFSGIMKILTPVIEMMYPALIVLCLLNIGNHLYQIKSVKAPVYFVLGFACAMICFS